MSTGHTVEQTMQHRGEDRQLGAVLYNDDETNDSENRYNSTVQTT
jgi:hypothetical protein